MSVQLCNAYTVMQSHRWDQIQFKSDKNSSQKTYHNVRNRFTKYFAFLEKNSFPVQVGDLAWRICYSKQKILKVKIMKIYLADLQLFYIEYIFHKIELKV